MKNKYLKIFTLLLALAMLFGCSNNAAPVEESTATTAVKTTATTTESETQTTVATTLTTSVTTESATTTTKKASVKVSAEQDTEKATTKPLTTAATTTKPSVTSTTISSTECAITIQCKEILSHMDDLKDGHEEFVPKNGYFLKSCRLEYENDDTVYSVLKRACRENGIKMSARKTVYGMYVVGLNNIDEFDCGGSSGWTYYVNGDFPNVACDKYELHGGESIEFKYVV